VVGAAQPTLRLGVVVAGLLPFPQPPPGRPVWWREPRPSGGAFVWAGRYARLVDAAGLSGTRSRSLSIPLAWRPPRGGRQAHPPP